MQYYNSVYLLRAYNSFHYVSSDWQESKSSFSNENGLSTLNVKTLKIATYNVLFGAPALVSCSLVTRDVQRFRYYANDLIPKESPDILILNEVVPLFEKELFASKFVQSNYYLSSLTASSRERLHGLLILAKHPFFVFDVAFSDRLIVYIALFYLNKDIAPFIVIACHLDAYESRAERRNSYIKAIRYALDSYVFNSLFYDSYQCYYAAKAFHQAIQNRNVLLLGDMNLHFPFETMFLYENQFIDAWIERKRCKDDQKDDDEGYTWDAQRNALTFALLPFDNRRMRLDRIAFLKDTTLFSEVQEVRVCATDKIGFCLAASDHFMLTANIALRDANQKPSNYYQKVSYYQVAYQCTEKKHAYRSIYYVVFYRIASLATIAAFIIYLIVSFSGFGALGGSRSDI